jgi:hypothetical protein
MKGVKRLGVCLAIILALGGVAKATSVGGVAGVDPTGIWIFTVLSELPLTTDLDLRAAVGLATGDLAGLMLVTGSLLYHWVTAPVDPFFGLGVGAALTPPPFTTGLVAEGTAGVRVLAADALVVFAEVRYLVRWSAEGITSGPIYEAGLEVRF